MPITPRVMFFSVLNCLKQYNHFLTLDNHYYEHDCVLILNIAKDMIELIYIYIYVERRFTNIF